MTVERLEDRCTPAVFTVNSLSDVAVAGKLNPRDAFVENGTLAIGSPQQRREAQISGLLHAAGGDTIQSAPNLFTSGAATINLDTALPDISTKLTVTGPAASELTIERLNLAATNFSVFTVDSGVTAVISGVTIAGGTGTSISGVLVTAAASAVRHLVGRKQRPHGRLGGIRCRHLRKRRHARR